MSEQYKATICGDRIEWDDDITSELRLRTPIKVNVTITSKTVKPRKSDGRKMAAALGRIAEAGGVASIPDPMKWQRGIRKERTLTERR